MKTFKILAALSALTLSSFGFASDKPEIKIVEVRGHGNGCPVDADGKPEGWNITFSNVTKAIVVDFSEFLVDAEKKTASCHLRMWLSVPQGKTAMTYFSQFTGTADMADEDYGMFAAGLLMNGREFPPVSYTIRGGTQDDWETDQAEAPTKVTAPCGGDLIKVEYKLNLSLFGNDSEIQLSSQLGKFDGIKIEVKDCK